MNTLDSHIEGFLHYISIDKNYATHTVTNYAIDIRAFSQYITTDYELKAWDEVQTIHLRSYLSTMITNRLSPTTIRRKKSSIQSFYKWMMKHNIVTSNPAKLLPTPKIPPRLPTTLEPQAVNALMDIQHQVIDEDDWLSYNKHIISTLLFETGMRRMEICQLSEADFSRSRLTLRVLGKGSKTREIPIGKATADLIKSYIEAKRMRYGESTALLVTHSGVPIYPQYVYRIVKALLGEISKLKKRSPHVLRHTFATALLNNGADIKAIQDLLGHSSLAATQVYTHTNIEQLKKEFRKSHPRN